MAFSILFGLLGVVLGAACVWVWSVGRLARLRTDCEVATRALEAERQARADDRVANERLNAEKDKAIDASVRRLVAEVTSVTHEALKARERELSERNGRQVAGLLEPMRQQLDDFRKAAEASRKTSGELGIRFEDVFKSLQVVAGDFGRQAKSFTDALAGANKKQGNWGEKILEQVLSDCGLREGVHYVTQTGSGSGIPDCQVFDPGAKKILIVDAKMSWTKYEEAYRLEPGPERTAALREHVQSLKRHVDELVKADYPTTQTPPREGYDYVPLTAMFVPCNAALQAAIESDAGLVDYAFKNNVALVSPLTLFGFLQLVSRGWSKYNVQKNSEEIFRQAKLLVERIDRLFKSLEEVSGHLDKARASCESALSLASVEARGACIKGSAQKIIQLAGRPDRALRSKALVEVADAETTEAVDV